MTTTIPSRNRHIQQRAARVFVRWFNAGADQLKEQQRMATLLQPGEAIETKYHIVDNQIRNIHTGEVVPFDEVVIFRARDNAFPNALEAYHVACGRLGAPEAHIAAARELLRRVQSWREQNKELCRLPGLRYTVAQNLMAIETEKLLQQTPDTACCGGGSCAGG